MKHDIFIFIIGFLSGGATTSFLAYFFPHSVPKIHIPNPTAEPSNPATIIPDERSDPFEPPQP